MLFLLDTDTVVDVIRKRGGVAHRLAQVSPEDVAVSAMTVAELTYGAMVSANPVKRMRETMLLLEGITVLPMDASVAREQAGIRMALRRAPIGQSDMIIAATAVVSARTLVSSNLREFSRVPGLRVESWR